MKRSLVKNSFINIASFGIYLLTQQLIIMPILSKWYSVNRWSEIAYLLVAFNIMIVLFGDELGNTHFVNFKSGVVSRPKLFCALLLTLLFIAFSIAICVSWLIGLPVNYRLVYAFMVGLGIYRSYISCVYRFRCQYSYVLLTHALYPIGAIAGLYMLQYCNMALLPFILGEMLSVCTILTIRHLTQKQGPIEGCLSSAETKKTVLAYLNLMGSSLLHNATFQADKMLILPVLGHNAMAIYYCTSIFSKSIATVANPVSNVLLSTLVHMNDCRSAIYRALSQIGASIIALFVFNVAITYIGVLLFYPQHHSNSTSIIVPICLSTVLSVVSFMIRPMLMLYKSTRFYFIINVLCSFSLLLCLLVVLHFRSILLFPWAVVVARVMQLAIYGYSLRSLKGEIQHSED